MKMRYSFLLLSFFYLIACQDKVETIDIPVVNFGNDCKESLLDRIKCQFIPLSTDSILLGRIDVVKFVDKRIFVWIANGQILYVCLAMMDDSLLKCRLLERGLRNIVTYQVFS